MKNTMVYLLALALAAAAFLTGCGEMRKPSGGAADPSATPTQTAFPETMMPDPEDGIVRDRDGIITEEDNAGSNSKLPESSANPKTGAGKSEDRTLDRKPSALR